MLVRGAERKVQRWVVRDDHSLERAQILAWLESELLDQFEACFLVGAQGIALSAAPIEREHLQVAQTLSPRMAPGERIDLRQDGFVPSELELRVEPQLERRQDGARRDGLTSMRAAPSKVRSSRGGPRQYSSASRRAAARSRGARSRASTTACSNRIESTSSGVDVDQVPGRSRLDHVASQHAAQAEDAVLDVGVDRFRRTLTPKLVDQADRSTPPDWGGAARGREPPSASGHRGPAAPRRHAPRADRGHGIPCRAERTTGVRSQLAVCERAQAKLRPTDPVEGGSCALSETRGGLHRQSA